MIFSRSVGLESLRPGCESRGGGQNFQRQGWIPGNELRNEGRVEAAAEEHESRERAGCEACSGAWIGVYDTRTSFMTAAFFSELE